MKKRLISLLLSIAMITQTGCAQRTGQTGADAQDGNSSSFIDDISENEEIILDEYKKELAEQVLTFYDVYDTKIASHMNVLNNFLIDYSIGENYEYGLQGSCTYKFDGDIDRLYSKIVKNSVLYAKSNPMYKPAVSNEVDDENEHAKYLKLISNTVKTYLSELYDEGTNNINNDFHNLELAKIVYRYCEDDYELDMLSYYDMDNNAIVILMDNFEMFFSYEQYSNMYIKNGVITTLLHEFEHVRHNVCACDNYLNDFSNEMCCDNIQTACDYNGSISSFLDEASAESYLVNYNTILDDYKDFLPEDGYVYSKYRGDEALLFLMSMFRNLNNYYDAIDDTNKFLMYLALGARTNSDINSIFNIIYSFDMLDGRNYEGLSNIQNIKELVGTNHIAEIYRIFLRDLVYYSSNKEGFIEEERKLATTLGIDFKENTCNLSIEDICLIYSFAREVIVNSAAPDGKLDMDFLQTFVELDEVFLYYLGECYSLSDEELEVLLKEAFKSVRYLFNFRDEEDVLNNNSQYRKLTSAFPKLKWTLNNSKFPMIFSDDILMSNYEDLSDGDKKLIFS